MKHLYLVLLSALSLSLTAQIQIGEYEFLTGGYEFQVDRDSTLVNVVIGPSGANQTWNFSGLQADESSLQGFEYASWTAGASLFPTSNVARNEGGGDYFYFTQNANGFYADGAYADFDGNGSHDALRFDDNLKLLQFPISMSDTFSDAAHGIVRFPGGTVQGVTYDSAYYESHIDSYYEVDAYGTVQIPMGTYDALRAKIVTITTDSIFFYALGIKNFFQEIATTTYEVQWYSDHADIGGPLITATCDAGFNSIFDISYASANPSVSVAELNDFTLNVYPNPASKQLTVEISDKTSAELNVFDLTGKLVLSSSVNEMLNQIDVSALAKGSYVYSITSSTGLVLRKNQLLIF